MYPSTTALRRWLQRTQDSKAEKVTFSEALLGHKILFYVIYKLRNFTVYSLLLMSMHLLEFYLLTRVFSYTRLESPILIRVLSFAISSGWWGGLEVLRDKTRAVENEKDVEAAKQLGNWNVLTFGVAGAIGLTSAALIVMAYTKTGLAQLRDFYFAAIFMGLSLHLIAETARSGIYSAHQIRQPFFSQFIGPITGLITLGGFWFFVGRYTLVISALLTALVTDGLMLYYVQRSKRLYRWPKPKWPSVSQFKLFLMGLFSTKEFALATCAYLFIDISQILIVLLSFTEHNIAIASSLFILFYFIDPLFQADSNWATRFYTDLKKYSARPIAPFMPDFNRKMLLLTPFIGLFYWTIAVLFAVGYFTQSAYIFSLILLVLFVLRAGIAYLQLLAFCEKRYLDIILSGGLILLSVLIMPISSSLAIQFLILISFLFASFFSIRKPRLPALRQAAAKDKTMHYKNWFMGLAGVSQPVQIFRLTIIPQTTSEQRTRLINNLQLNPKPSWLWLDYQTLLGFIENPAADVLTFLPQMTAHNAGLILSCQAGPIVATGQQALQYAYSQQLPLLLPASLHSLQSNASNAISQLEYPQLLTQFTAQFPYGCVLDKGQANYPNFLFTGRYGFAIYCQNLLEQLQKYMVTPCQTMNGNEFSISVIFLKAIHPVIFIIPLSYENRTAAKSWNLSLYLWNVRHWLMSKFRPE